MLLGPPRRVSVARFRNNRGGGLAPPGRHAGRPCWSGSRPVTDRQQGETGSLREMCAVSDRASAYVREIQGALGLLQAEEVEAGLTLLAEALRHDRGVYICGNGGSASTASHLAVDLGKNLRTSSGERMRVVSLTDNVPWLTAAANDEGYDNCFAAQLRNYVRPDDVVVGISASGNSQNVVRAFQLAQDRSGPAPGPGRVRRWPHGRPGYREGPHQVFRLRCGGEPAPGRRPCVGASSGRAARAHGTADFGRTDARLVGPRSVPPGEDRSRRMHGDPRRSTRALTNRRGDHSENTGNG